MMDDGITVLVLEEKEKRPSLPRYATEEAVGADVHAFVKQPLTIEPGSSALIPTGLYLQLPKGYEIQIRPRSGLALKHQITVLNAPGTIDSDYRGEIGVILINHGRNCFVVEPGMRIAQFVLAKTLRAEYLFASELLLSSRGEGGFGHTGLLDE